MSSIYYATHTSRFNRGDEKKNRKEMNKEKFVRLRKAAVINIYVRLKVYLSNITISRQRFFNEIVNTRKASKCITTCFFLCFCFVYNARVDNAFVRTTKKFLNVLSSKVQVWTQGKIHGW